MSNLTMSRRDGHRGPGHRRPSTAESVVRAHLERIAARDDAVRAWAHLDPSAALDAAIALTAAARAGRSPVCPSRSRT